MQALRPVKKSITVTQMTQFALILVQVPCQLILCGMDRIVLFYFSTVIMAMFYGFYDFYSSAYQVAQRGKSQTPLSDSKK